MQALLPAVTLLAAALLAGCSPGGTAPQPRLLKVGLAHPPNHTFSLALEKFAAHVEAASNGRFEVRLYPASQLGSEREMQEMLTLGSLELSVTGVLNIYEPMFSVYEMPYLYRDRDHVLRVMEEMPAQSFAHNLQRQGLRVLGFYENGFRNVTNSRRPIHTPADLQGLIIRTPENPAQFETFKALGANPTPMSFAELYTALAQGVVDGQENPLQNIASANLNEVQRHLAVTRHIYNVAYVVISERFWQKLPPSDQRILENALHASTRWQLDTMSRLDQQLAQTLQDRGMEFTWPDTAPFEAAVQPAYDAIFQKLGPDARLLVDQIRRLRDIPQSSLTPVP